MVSDYLIGLFEVPRPPGVRPDGMTVRELLDKGRLQIESDDQVRPEIRARVVGILGSLYNPAGPVRRDRAATCRSGRVRL